MVHSKNDATYRFLFRMEKTYFERLLLNFRKPWKTFGLQVFVGSAVGTGGFVRAMMESNLVTSSSLHTAVTLLGILCFKTQSLGDVRDFLANLMFENTKSGQFE